LLYILAFASGCAAALLVRAVLACRGSPVRFLYVNWKGHRAERTVLPLKVWYGRTEQHPAKQWFLKAWDLDKAAVRDFAMRDVDGGWRVCE
jgi:predicted DNA-binding transcriptional regulator YafY